MDETKNWTNKIKDEINLIFSLINKSFKTVVQNPAIILIFVIYLIFLGILFFLSVTTISTFVGILSTLGAILLLFAFLSGWLQVIKESFEPEKIKSKNYFSVFLEGIGKNIFPTFITTAILTIIMFVCFFFASKIALHFFGSLNFIYDDIIKLQQTNGSLIEYAKNLSDDKLFSIYGWNLCYLIVTLAYFFLSMFVYPSLLNDNKTNIFLKPFMAFVQAFKFTFKNFFSVSFLYLLICIAFVVIEFLKFIAKMIALQIVQLASIFQFIFLFVSVYFMANVVMLIFNYYEQKNHCFDRSDSIGENESINTISKED